MLLNFNRLSSGFNDYAYWDWIHYSALNSHTCSLKSPLSTDANAAADTQKHAHTWFENARISKRATIGAPSLQPCTSDEPSTLRKLIKLPFRFELDVNASAASSGMEEWTRLAICSSQHVGRRKNVFFSPNSYFTTNGWGIVLLFKSSSMERWPLQRNILFKSIIFPASVILTIRVNNWGFRKVVQAGAETVPTVEKIHTLICHSVWGNVGGHTFLPPSPCCSPPLSLCRPFATSHPSSLRGSSSLPST